MTTVAQNVTSDVRKREQVLNTNLLLPLAFSSIITGVWAALAFTRPHFSLTLLLFAGICTLVSAVFFSLSVLTLAYTPLSKRSTASLRQDLARCSLASIIFLLYMPEYLARVQPPHVRSFLLLGVVLLLWTALSASVLGRIYAFTLSAKAARNIGSTAVLSLFLVTTFLAIRKYQVFGYVGQDLAYFGQVLHTTLNGHLFWGNLLQDLLYTKPVTTDFAGHNSPVMFLFLPFYKLVPSPITLIVLRNLVVFTCVIPIIRISCRYTTLTVAWLWAFAFVLTPTILYQTTFDFYPLSLVALPLLFSVDFYLSKRLLPFSIVLLSTLMVREDLVFFVFGLGLLAALQRRAIRWVLIPIAAATAWGILSFLIVIPHSLHGASFVTDACFCHLGNSPLQMARSVLTHPTHNVLSHNNIVYLKTLLTPSGLIVPAASPASALAIPYLAINLLAGGGACITNVIYAQYSVIPATILFLGSVIGLIIRRDSVFARGAGLGLSGTTPPALVLLALAVSSLIFTTGADQIDDFRSPVWQAEAEHVLTLIPASASVAAPRYMLPHLANRDCLYQTHRLSQYHHPVYEYLIMDEDWSHINASSAYQDSYRHLLLSSATDSRLQLIYASPQYRVYQDPAAHNLTCFDNQ